MFKNAKSIKHIFLLLLLSVVAALCAVGCVVEEQSGSSDSDYVGGEISISIEECGDITVMAGEMLSLPKATASDEKGKDYSDKIKIRCSTATILSDTFVAYTAMDHIVYYYLYDATDKLICESIAVKVLAKNAETTIPEGGNDLNNLKTEGKVFYENFEKGNNSPLIESSLTQKMYIGATENSINGNSLIMEWTDTSGDYAKRISDVTEYISGVYGQYTLGFDLKLVSGIGDPTWYFGVYNIELATDELRSFTNKNVDLSKLNIGDTIHLEKDFLLDGNGTYYLEFFTLTASTEMTIAIDNVTLVYNQIKQTIPDEEQVAQGFVWDWSKNQMHVGEGGITSAPNRITAKGFGEKVLKLTTGGYHDFTATNGIFKAGVQYRISFNYCIDTSADIFYFMVKNSALTEDENIAESSKVYWDLTPWKTDSFEYVFTATESHTLFSVLVGYAGGTIYIGDFKVESIEVKEYTLPSQEQLKDGYTFAYSEDLPVSYQDWINYPFSGPYVYTENFVDKPVDIKSPTFSDKALRINCYGYTRFDFTKGLFEAGGIYRVSFEFSVYNTIAKDDGICFWLQNSKNDLTNGDGIFPKCSWNGTRYQTQSFSGTFKAVDGDDTFNIYVSPGNRSGYIVIFVSEITVQRLYPDTDTPTQDQIANGYTYEMSAMPQITSQQWILNSSGNYKTNYNFVDCPDSLRGNANFGEKVLKITEIGYCAKFDFMQGILTKGNKYRVTFSVYTVTTRADNLIVGHTSTDQANILQQYWHGSGKENSSEILTFNVEFIALENDFIYIYMGASGSGNVEMYLGDVTVTDRTPYQPTEEEFKNGYKFSMAQLPTVTTQQYLSAGNGDYTVNTNFVDRPDSLSGNANFGEKVLKITEIGYCAKFDFMQGILTKGNKYRVTFSVYTVTTRADNLIVGHTSTDQANILQQYWHGSGKENSSEILTFNVEFIALENDFIYIYMGASGSGNVEMYLGDVTVTDITQHQPTEEEFKNGYKFSMAQLPTVTTQQYLSAGNGDYAANTNFVDRPDSLSGNANFGEKVLKITEIGYCAKFDFMQGILTKGNKYRVTFSVYTVTTRADNLIVGHTSTDQANILQQCWRGSGKENSSEILTFNVEFIALENDFIYIYMGASGSGNVEMYLGDVTVTDITQHQPTEEDLKNGYKFSMAQLPTVTTQQYLSAGNGDYAANTNFVDRPDSLSGNANFGEKVLKITEIGYCAKFDFMQGILTKGNKYRVTFSVYTVTTRADNLIVGHTSTDQANILQQYWHGSGKENSSEILTFNVEFIALENDFVYIYMGASGSGNVEMYLGDVTVTDITQHQPTEE